MTLKIHSFNKCIYYLHVRTMVCVHAEVRGQVVGTVSLLPHGFGDGTYLGHQDSRTLQPSRLLLALAFLFSCWDCVQVVKRRIWDSFQKGLDPAEILWLLLLEQRKLLE